MITNYPEWTDLQLEMQRELKPALHAVTSGISEFTFANLYLFRKVHAYKITKTPQGLYILSGKKAKETFFLLPCGLPEADTLQDLFASFSYLKNASEQQAALFAKQGYLVEEDRDNFDYLYLRQELAHLRGKKFHKKRTHVNAFINNYNYRGAPILESNVADALQILEKWQQHKEGWTDYPAAREALEKNEALGLCGSLVYVEGKPAAYTLGEELGQSTTFAIHFEKALGDYKGLYQFINKCFAALLPPQYTLINREQDLGDEGLRRAKLSYKPYGFTKKYRVVPSKSS